MIAFPNFERHLGMLVSKPLNDRRQQRNAGNDRAYGQHALNARIELAHLLHRFIKLIDQAFGLIAQQLSCMGQHKAFAIAVK